MSALELLLKPDWRDVWKGIPLPETGSVYTKPEVVDLILDLAGYEPRRKRLLARRLLEPSCGDGAFLEAVIKRLVASEMYTQGCIDWDSTLWAQAVTAVDLDQRAVVASRHLVTTILCRLGCSPQRAGELAVDWIVHSDFLLHDWREGRFDYVVGNPPYVRLEDMPSRVLMLYRDIWRTTTDRADLYIPFFECGLGLLNERGVLAFICANRFAKNQYGAALRRLIARQYRVRHYINLEHTQPFLSDVSAYPAVVVVDRRCGANTRAATVTDLAPATLRGLRAAGRGRQRSDVFGDWYPDGAPWVTTSRTRKASLDALAQQYPTLEDSAPGTRVGIGIATGADDIFVLKGMSDSIEATRQVPLVMARDIANAGLKWSGHMLVNPFDDADDGSLVDLSRFPAFGCYLARHADRLKGRHCAKSRPQTWYRTIDRFWPRLLKTPKLLIPDIQTGGVIGYDGGHYYPHHNVYWITSETWDLRVLQKIMQSELVTDQIRAHSVAMRGGSLRYQAQSLRRLRIPPP